MSETNQADINTLGFVSATEELQNNFKQVEDMMKMFSDSHQSMNLDPFNLGEAYTDWMAAVAKDPAKAMQASMDFWQQSMQLTQQAMSHAFAGEGQEKPEPVIAEGRGDRRFKHDDWSDKPVFDVIKQSYLLTSDYARKLVSDVDGLDEKTEEKVKFFTERYLDAMSPTNFAATNPAVLEKTMETKGANLLHGLKNMIGDLEAGEGKLKISMTDTSAFTLGENVATTPGKVVFQNRMFQLIQFSPSTDKVLKRPLLIVPPWINKYYIMDLQPKNSLLKWLVDEGHTVFVMSWVNPDETYRDVGFDHYVTEGVIKAVDAVENITGEDEINAIGYCIGGSLLTTTLAYMKANNDARIKSATFFTTMIDFEDPGELGVYIDEKQICGIEQNMEEEGYLDGTQMAGAFNLLRANDLIWSFYVNNYLLGNDPRPFDLLYWNSDSTRMTAAMHSWYLRNLYLENNLAKPNALEINGTPIDVSSIDVPACFISTVDDHIAPWLSTYKGAKLFSGDVRFILGGSGHIAGIINPPEANKYGYRVTDELPDEPQAWADSANVEEGSWWPNWNTWIRPLSDEETIDARTPGDSTLPVIEDAPGTYVKCKLDDPTPVLEETKLVKPAAKSKPAKKAEPKAKVEKPAAVKAPKAEEKAKPKEAAPKVEAKPDDLTQIKGVGPKMAETLNDLGITTFAQIAELSAEQLSAKLVEVDARNSRYDTVAWLEQVAQLAKK
ncbi:MAG: Polyhydroxyalkanoic acid synthase [uncultured Thiotrichaceae bacterium]|uniref:Polyhydroxyalkanoic acid synthase n=1 Tax=uncultured Thiotrichaceae bacterium TaxID=298394 RepID=A0A6S6RVJ9_9GAMM|nr:MAG: Polyhydroxyalkanoic acid synthase [uncultured Thiotrichaceae bacterium]